MKQIVLFLLLTISFAHSQEDCPPEGTEQLNSLTNLRIPNCRQTNQIQSESDRSRIIEIRKSLNKPIPNPPSPICQTCRQSFDAIISDKPEIKQLKRDAFFEASYKELEKSLTNIITDVVSLRKTWSTGSSYVDSVKSCNTASIESTIAKCNPSIAAKFHQKDLTGRLGREIASLINSTPEDMNGILSRSTDARSCEISDEIASTLKPRLIEEYITPSLIQSVANIQTSSSSELQTKLESALGANLARLMRSHPILRPLMQQPTKFLEVFKSFKASTNTDQLKKDFRARLYNKNVGDLIDQQNAEKCRAAIQTFSTAFCTNDFKNGNLSMGPFHNYQKYIDDSVLSENESSTSDSDIAQNTLMFSFCDSSNGQSLNSTLNSMNSWMLDADRFSPLNRFAAEKYGRDFGDLKTGLCDSLKKSSQEQCSDDDEQCKLLKIYSELKNSTSPQSRIASSADPNINKVLRSFIGNPSTLPVNAKNLLIAEGIIPQANGQFVERPTPPERDSGYLAGVANGTINPNVGGGSQLASSTRSQNSQQALAQQQAVFQPQAQTAAIAPSITPNTDDDDSEASRAVFNDLEQRRLRNQPQAANNQQRQVPSTRRSNPTQDQFAPLSSNPTIASLTPVMNAPVPGSGANFAPVNNTEARLERDPNAQTKAQRDRNAALAEFQSARENPNAAVGGAGRGPASTDAQAGRTSSGDQTVAMTVSGDIRASLERVLNGSDANGADLRNKIREQIPFRFQLNNQTFDVQFNNGACVVTSRSNVELARTLQGLFNNSLRSNGRSAAGRSDTLENLRQNLR